MSWNLHFHCKVDNGDEGWWILPRALSGITHSATICQGDIIEFDGLELVVERIRHKHVRPGSDFGPVSEARCITPAKTISVDQMASLINHGFKRISRD